MYSTCPSKFAVCTSEDCFPDLVSRCILVNSCSSWKFYDNKITTHRLQKKQINAETNKTESKTDTEAELNIKQERREYILYFSSFHHLDRIFFYIPWVQFPFFLVFHLTYWPTMYKAQNTNYVNGVKISYKYVCFFAYVGYN